MLEVCTTKVSNKRAYVNPILEVWTTIDSNRPAYDPMLYSWLRKTSPSGISDSPLSFVSL